MELLQVNGELPGSPARGPMLHDPGEADDTRIGPNKRFGAWKQTLIALSAVTRLVQIGNNIENGPSNAPSVVVAATEGLVLVLFLTK
jgi:hypothetical protein